ncbi:MAG: mechanosensitive ion channel family protein [Alphaproteobacteria bacterium]|nr:MAG: mechanosensitive ion channel family protein [Alphaproteobacteria bacterium]
MKPPFPAFGRGLALALALSLTLVGGAFAQTATAPEATSATSADTTAQAAAPAATPTAPEAAAESVVDYAAWERLAQRAEQAIEAGRASDQALLNLRAELVSWRDTLTAAQSANQVKIKTLQTQLDALGPKPGKRESEPASVTEQRKELTRQLEEAEAPVKAAEVALARDNELIAQLDELLRNRKAAELYALGPSPLNPALWPEALSDLSQTLRLAWAGVVATYGTDTQRAEMRANAPAILALAVLALVLMLRGKAWAGWLGGQILPRARGASFGLLATLVSVGQYAAPWLGVLAAVEALHKAGFLGLRAQVLVDELPAVALSFFVARWLGSRVFDRVETGPKILNLPPSTRAEGRVLAALLGLDYGLWQMVGAVSAYEGYGEETRVVLGFPLLALAALILLRLGQFLRRHTRAEGLEHDEGASFLARTLGLGGMGLIAVGAAGLLAGAIGYTGWAVTLVFPTVLTLAVIALLLVLHGAYVEAYAYLRGFDEEKARASLLPLVMSFFSILAATPVLALIWGARVSDLQEMWARIMAGVTIGGIVLTPADVLTFLIVFAAGVGLTRLIQGALRTTVLPRTRIDQGGRTAIVSGVGYLGIFIALMVAVTTAGIDLSALAVVAGALSVGIGFGLQNIVSNFVSGIILLIERPISEGDWINVGGQEGYVRDISVRSTRIETFDRTDVILPNSDLISGVVTNYTRGNLIGRVIVPVGVAYGSDTKRVEQILLEVARAHPLVTVNPPPSVYFREFGADSLNFEIRAILKDVNYKLSVLSDMNHEIARRFAEEGIEIPFAQRDIWLRNPEALGAALGGGGREAEKERGDD